MLEEQFVAAASGRVAAADLLLAQDAELNARFLQDIPSHLIASKPNRKTTEIIFEDTSSSNGSMLELKTGDSVLHSKFGEGIVTECYATKDDHEITVSFKGGVGVKKLLLSLARLEKIL